MNERRHVTRAFLLLLAVGCSRPPAHAVVPGAVNATRQAILAGEIDVPTYPVLMLSAGVDGEVTLALAVLPDGRVDSTRTTIVRSTHQLFTNAVLAVLPRWRVTRAPPRDGRLAVVTIAFALPKFLGVPQIVHAPDSTREGGALYYVGDRPPRGPSRLLTMTEPLADSLRAAARAAGYGPDFPKMQYFSEEQVAIVNFSRETSRSLPQPCPAGQLCGGARSGESGICVLSRRATDWPVRCRVTSYWSALY